MTEVLADSLQDCLRLLPFLFLTYLFVEYIEHRMSTRTKEWIYRAGKAGPLLGGLIGVIPQCGFSAVAAGLFAAGIVSPGTLIAVFLSTSDEMLPLMISEHMAASLIIKILAVKVTAGVLIGFLVDFAAVRLHLWVPPKTAHPQWKYSREPGAFKPIRVKKTVKNGQKNSGGSAQTVPGDMPYSSPVQKSLCENDHCGCAERGIFRSALIHTGQIMVLLFLISFVLGLGMDWFKESRFANGIFSFPGTQEVLAALIGMIPNCAASVLITQLFLEGVLSGGALLAGLLCGAGTGLIVLFRENADRRADLALTAVLYVSGLVSGMAAGALQIL